MAKNGNDLIFVQVIQDQTTTSSNTAVNKLPAGASAIKGGSVTAALYEAITCDDIQVAIERICTAVGAGLSNASPQSCSVEFNLGFKAGAKVPVLMSGEASGGLKITLAWKKNE